MEEIKYKGKVVATIDPNVTPKKIKVLNRSLFKEMQESRPKAPINTDPVEVPLAKKSNVFKKMFSWI